jgi:hypothetical protein
MMGAGGADLGIAKRQEPRGSQRNCTCRMDSWAQWIGEVTGLSIRI